MGSAPVRLTTRCKKAYVTIASIALSGSQLGRINQNDNLCIFIRRKKKNLFCKNKLISFFFNYGWEKSKLPVAFDVKKECHYFGSMSRNRRIRAWEKVLNYICLPIKIIYKIRWLSLVKRSCRSSFLLLNKYRALCAIPSRGFVFCERLRSVRCQAFSATATSSCCVWY